MQSILGDSLVDSSDVANAHHQIIDNCDRQRPRSDGAELLLLADEMGKDGMDDGKVQGTNAHFSERFIDDLNPNLNGAAAVVAYPESRTGHDRFNSVPKTQASNSYGNVENYATYGNEGSTTTSMKQLGVNNKNVSDDHHSAGKSHSSSQEDATFFKHAVTASRASPFTVKWLLDNFESAEGVSLPRATLYALYLQHCSECAVESMNAASFGKMIRSIFSGLRTRRLGTRGNSKYHYYGIKLKTNSDLQKRLADVSLKYNKGDESSYIPLGHSKALNSQNTPSSGVMSKKQRSGIQKHLNSMKSLTSGQSSASITQSTQMMAGDYLGCEDPHQTSLWKAQMRPVILRDINMSCPELKSFRTADILEFRSLYAEHLDASVVSINSGSPENLIHVWKAFWRHKDIDESSYSFQTIDNRLRKSIFLRLCECQEIVNFVYDSDALFYQSYADMISSNLNQGLSDFSLLHLKASTNGIQEYISVCTAELPPAIGKAKFEIYGLYMAHLKHISSIKHTADSVKMIFKSKTSLQLLSSDLGQTDQSEINARSEELFYQGPKNETDNISDGNQPYKQIIDGFLASEEFSFDQILATINSAFENKAQRPVEGATSASTVQNNSSYSIKELREFYVKWNIYSSLILRQMTLSGCNSFAIFHLLRTFLDDLILLSVKRIAAKIYRKPCLLALQTCSKYDTSDDSNKAYFSENIFKEFLG